MTKDSYSCAEAEAGREDWLGKFELYTSNNETRPLYLTGDALDVLAALPDHCIDFVMTSPPYWGQREYAQEGIGLEPTPGDYIRNILNIAEQIQRVLKPTGSFWLNIGDKYVKKSLSMIPSRIALSMIDEQGWTLRNNVVWHKIKGGPDNANDKLRNVHEPVFHFVKQSRGYFYDVDAIRKTPGKTSVSNGKVVSSTGVSGVRYRRQIELSNELSQAEKEDALSALAEIQGKLSAGELSDYRMVIRGNQRTTHSNSTRVSGRAKELRDRGFYFLKYNPKGTKPSDLWEIMPEDTHKRKAHFAPYPEELCRIPLLATCPPDGIALDPFCGTGTTNVVAADLGRKSVGIDIASDYLNLAGDRSNTLF